VRFVVLDSLIFESTIVTCISCSKYFIFCALLEYTERQSRMLNDATVIFFLTLNSKLKLLNNLLGIVTS